MTNTSIHTTTLPSATRIRRVRNQASVSSSVTHAGKQKFHSYCSTDIATISQLYLTCSSQSYKNKYTQSLTCSSGDRVHVHIYFTIEETNDNNDIAITIATGLYGKRKRIYRRADLCSVGTVDSLSSDYTSSSSSSGGGSSSSSSGSGGSSSSSSSSYHKYKRTCPSAGNYHLYTYFTLPSLTSDTELQYTPDLYVNFTNFINNNDNNQDDGGRQLYGGGSTAAAVEATAKSSTNQNARRKSCFATGTRYHYYTAKARRSNGILALGLATTVFCLLFSVCIYMSWRRKKRIEKERQARQEQHLQDDDESQFEYMRERHGQVAVPWNHHQQHHHQQQQQRNHNNIQQVPLDRQIQHYRQEMSTDMGGISSSTTTNCGDGSVTTGSSSTGNSVPIPSAVPGIVPIRYPERNE